MTNSSHLSFVRVNGADADTFLNGQFTQSTLDLRPGDTRFGAFCSPKGRALAVAWLHRTDTDLELWTDLDVLDPLLNVLRRYVMRANVVFEPPTDTPATRVVQLADGLGDIDLASHAFAHDAVRLGVPTINAATTEQFVPQMINLDRLGGIDFAKGCYTGQEIVARTHNLGTIKRRMLAFACTNAKQIKGGDEVSDATGAKVGQVVSANEDTVLAVMRLAALGNTLHAGPANLPLGEVRALPYAIPEYAALN